MAAAKKKTAEKADEAAAASEAAGPGPSLEGRAEENAEAQKAEAEATESNEAQGEDNEDANKEASEDAGDPGEGPVVVDSRDVAREQRVREREAGAREERERTASVHDEPQDPKENNPDQVLEVEDSYRDEVAKEYEWRNRVANERERHLRIYQLGRNPFDEEPADEEAAEEVRKDPNFAVLAGNSDSRTGVENLAEGKTDEEAAVIRREQRRQLGNMTQNDETAKEAPEVEKESSADSSVDDADDKK